MISSIQIASAGISAAEKRFDGAARDIARAGTEDPGSAPSPATRLDLSAAALDALQATSAVEMNTAVLKTANAMQKRLLDVVA